MQASLYRVNSKLFKVLSLKLLFNPNMIRKYLDLYIETNLEFEFLKHDPFRTCNWSEERFNIQKLNVLVKPFQNIRI